MQTGDLVDDFTLTADDGSSITLSEFVKNGPVVLFFYPKAMTSGCTKESCHFRDLASEFKAVGAQRLGISLDPVNKQRQFSERHSFDYPLLSDATGSVAKQFGVKRMLPFAKRATFVIGTDLKIIGVIESEINMDKHADDALALLTSRSGPSAGS